MKQEKGALKFKNCLNIERWFLKKGLNSNNVFVTMKMSYVEAAIRRCPSK